MNSNRQKGITQLVVLGLMAFLALGLPLTTKLVQQNQENRSQAAVSCGNFGTLSICNANTACKWSYNGNYCEKRPNCTDYTFTSWGTCYSTGKQYRQKTGTTPTGCIGTPPSEKLILSRNCTPPKPCADYTFTAWGTCNSLGKQYRTKTGKTPVNCFGEPPVEKRIFVRDCTPSCASLGGVCVADSGTCIYGKLGTLVSGKSSCDNLSKICCKNISTVPSCTSQNGQCVASGTCTGTKLKATGCTSNKSDCCYEPIIKVTGITVTPISKTIEVGDKFTITAKITPENATNKNLNWSSGNSSVATVNNGAVTAKSPGVTVIFINSQDGNYKGVKTVAITVAETKPDFVGVTDITISSQSKTINLGQSFTITANVLPTDATNKGLKWESSNASVASVNSAGTVTAKESGKTTITVSSVEDSSIKKMVEVIVNQSATGGTAPDVVNVTEYSLSLKPTSLTLGVDESELVQPTLTPKRTSEVLSWKSSDNSIARVYIPYCSGNYFSRCVGSNYYLDGTVKKCTKCAGIRQVKIVGIKKGTATITVTASPSGAKETIKVTVK